MSASVLVLRPRRIFAAVAALVALGVPAGLLWLSYQGSFFDPRMVIVVPAFVVFGGVAAAARIVVADGTLTRQLVKAHQRGTRLDALTGVRLRRPRFSRREGVPGTHVLQIDDRLGRSTMLKPVYWRHGAGELLAVLAACVRAQGIDVDERTAQALAGATERFRDIVPAWAYRPSPTTLDDEPAAAPRDSTFWTRRNPDGTPRKAQPQRLVPLLLMFAVTLPLALVSGRVGTKAIRSVKCGNQSGMWSASADVVTSNEALVPMLFRIQRATYEGAAPKLYRLGANDLSNSKNTAAVQRDTSTLVQGVVAVWANGAQERAELQVETFPTHAAALAFQRDYGDDHCHGGDLAFHTPDVAGGVGFRTQCYRCSHVTDRVSFVRGTTRVQSIVWRVRLRDSHDAAMRLARIADGTLPG